MKTAIKNLLVAAVLSGAAGSATAVEDRWETLQAINWVENPSNHTRPGRHGELGPYQFRQATWRMHTNRPFSQAVNRSAADEVAVKHYEWIKSALVQRGVEATAFNIAMAWNCGVDAVARGRAPHVSFDYAVRVTNLVQILKERTQSAASPEDVVLAPEPAQQDQTERGLNLRLEDLEGQPPSHEIRFRVFPDEPRFVLVATD